MAGVNPIQSTEEAGVQATEDAGILAQDFLREELSGGRVLKDYVAFREDVGFLFGYGVTTVPVLGPNGDPYLVMISCDTPKQESFAYVTAFTSEGHLYWIGNCHLSDEPLTTPAEYLRLALADEHTPPNPMWMPETPIWESLAEIKQLIIANPEYGPDFSSKCGALFPGFEVDVEIDGRFFGEYYWAQAAKRVLNVRMQKHYILEHMAEEAFWIEFKGQFTESKETTLIALYNQVGVDGLTVRQTLMLRSVGTFQRLFPNPNNFAERGYEDG